MRIRSRPARSITSFRDHDTSLRPWALALLLVGCTASPTPVVRTWGSMRQALKLGQSEARVIPTEVVGPHTIGVGALAELAGEVTVVDGRVRVAEGLAEEPGCSRAATSADAATLLVLADVDTWIEFELPACADRSTLEAVALQHLRELGRDPSNPTPLRVHGQATALDLHVIAGSCPVATPAGQAPWRHHAVDVEVELVGILAVGHAGHLTHHTSITHLHAVLGETSGHLDGIALAPGARLSLPATADVVVKTAP